MFFQKIKRETKLTFGLVGLAFFTATSAFVIAKLDASLNRPRAKLIAYGEKAEIHLTSSILAPVNLLCPIRQ